MSSHSLCNRRSFLLKTLSAGVALYTLQSCTTRKAVDGESDTIQIDITTQENNALKTVGGSVYIQNPNDKNYPIILYRAQQDTVYAFSSRCPHENGHVNPVNGDEVAVCQKHFAEFDTQGKVLIGPAVSDLASFNAALEGNIITITGI